MVWLKLQPAIIARELRRGAANEPPQRRTARPDQRLPIGIAISVLWSSMATGSWPESKLSLMCAVAAITVKIWAAEKAERSRQFPPTGGSNSEPGGAANCETS